VRELNANFHANAKREKRGKGKRNGKERPLIITNGQHEKKEKKKGRKKGKPRPLIQTSRRKYTESSPPLASGGRRPRWLEKKE